jgi:catechol 2,3-dioxygenase-like lactoylglutathione lyase family enzyme
MAATKPAEPLEEVDHCLELAPTEAPLLTIQALVETAIYVDDLQSAEGFYRTILGLRLIGKEPGRHVFFQVGEGNVLLAFLAEATLRGDQLPPHGARGPGHFALGIAAEAFEDWRKRLHDHGVPIEKEVAWPKGGRSLYFRDPAGNSVELLTPGVWGLPQGW